MTKKKDTCSQAQNNFTDLFKNYGKESSTDTSSLNMRKNCDSSEDYNILKSCPIDIQAGCNEDTSHCTEPPISVGGCPYMPNECESTKLYKPNQGNGGDYGAIGDMGCKGEKGERGCRGYTGEKGQKGCPGDKGPRGHSIKGDKGNMGLCGDTEYNGEKGQKGNRGCKGEEGCKGDRGNNGFHGLRGPPGCDGKPGEKGDGGCRGPKGEKGPRGCDGLKGEPGTAPILDLLCKQLSGGKGQKGCQGTSQGSIIGYSELDSRTQSFCYNLTQTITPIQFQGTTNNVQAMFQVTCVIPKSKKLLIEFNTVWVPDSPNWIDMYARLSLSSTPGIHTPVALHPTTQDDIYYRNYEWVKTDSDPSIVYLNPIFYVDYNMNSVTSVKEGDTVTFYLSASTGPNSPQQLSKLVFGKKNGQNTWSWAHSFARITDLGTSFSYVPNLEC